MSLVLCPPKKGKHKMAKAVAVNPAQQAQQQRANNAAARAAVISSAQKLTQPLFSGSFVPANQNVVNITPRNVGLILGFYIYVQGQLAAASGTGTLTQWGPANMLSQIQFLDLQNYTRHQTAGWHVSLINSVKSKGAFAGCNALSAYPVNFGNNWNVQSAPATITTGVNCKFLYYLPIAYSDFDLRGAIYAQVVSANMNLQITINPTPVVTGTNDATLAVYGGATTVTAGGWASAVTVTVHQVYYDQLPRQGTAPIVPPLDLATVYELKNTALFGLVVNQEYQIAYSNFRDFLSTSVIFDNGGTLNVGSDVNYWALQAANYVNLFNVPPYLMSVWANATLEDDMPRGTYYLDSRAKPISTSTYGNMNMVLSPSVVNANAALLVGFEDFGIQNQLIQAAGIANS